MKSSYIVVLVVLIIGGLVLFNLPAKEVAAPVTNEVQMETPTPTTPEPTATDMGMTAEEHAAMTEESTTGTDAGPGMEMPTPDTPVSSETAKSQTEKMFMVTGKNFSFDVQELRVKKGDTVTIHFMSEDGYHDLVIDEFNARTTKIETGGMAMVTFVASKTGTFEYYCSVGSHRMNGMVGKLIVE